MAGPEAAHPPAGSRERAASPHTPVLLAPLLRAVSPVSGVWIDATLGAGGYTRALLAAGADKVIAIDRDPLALEMATEWGAPFAGRLELVLDTFSNMDRYADRGSGGAAGVVMDLGVSSMQLDQAGRGFSFRLDGPLDMRMGREGPDAADLVARASEEDLADILHHYGEERAARRIARAIVRAREVAPITTTRGLARIVEGALPPARPDRIHPATRTFQALRIAVNDELGELARGLDAAARALAPGGRLAVVSFHSLEDRIVKHFISAQGGGSGGGVSRYAPEAAHAAPAFRVVGRAQGPDAREMADNPRARSARLRVAERTEAPLAAAGAAGTWRPVRPAAKRRGGA